MLLFIAKIVAPPCFILIFTLVIRAFPYTGYKPLDNIERYISHHGMNLSWVDLSPSQWDYWTTVLAPKTFAIFAGIDLIINVIFSIVYSSFNLGTSFVIAIFLAIAAMITSEIKAEKHQTPDKK